MRRSRGGAVALLALGIGAPRWAQAQYVEGRVSVMVAGGYSAIVTQSPAPPGVPLAGPSMSLTPSAALLLETARTHNYLAYAFSLGVPLTSQQAIQHVNRLDYTGRYQLDGHTTMLLV